MSNNLFRLVFDNTYQFIGLLDPQGRALEVNQTALAFAGVTLEEVVGQPAWETPWFPEAVRPRWKEAIAQAAQGNFVRYEMDIVGAGTQVMTIDFSLRPVKNHAGEITHLIAEGRDITERKEIEQALQESEARFRSAFNDASIGMAIVAPDGHFLDANSSLCEMLGYSPDELLVLGFQQVTHPDDLDTDLEMLRQLLLGELKTFQMEKRYLHKAGHIVWGHLSVSAVRNSEESVRYFISQVQDITARKHYEEQVRMMAYRDELTGLHNRRYFFEQAPVQLARAQRAGWPVALLYLDLNGFKEVNDTLGHRAGDELLKQVAQAFRQAFRKDELLARFGGDEFVAMLINATEVEALLTSERLVACAKRSLSRLSTPGQAGVSVGLVVAPDSTADVDSLLTHADRAMYRAKGHKASEPYGVKVVRLSARPGMG